MYLTTEIFKGELLIVSPNNNCEENEQLKWFIENYEPKILQCLLGQIYYDLKDHTIVAGDNYDLLLTGGEYTVNGEKYTFKGLKYILACFIYFYYQRENSIITSQFGGNVPQFEKADAVSLNGKIKRNWNNAQRLLNPKCNCTLNTCDVTLWEFLSHKEFDCNKYTPKFYEGGYLC